MGAYVAYDSHEADAQARQPVIGARSTGDGTYLQGELPRHCATPRWSISCAELARFISSVVVYDPLADARSALDEHNVALTNQVPAAKFNAIVLAVRHDEIVALGKDKLEDMLEPGGLIYDLKSVLALSDSHARI